jgi:hypothetical protein
MWLYINGFELRPQYSSDPGTLRLTHTKDDLMISGTHSSIPRHQCPMRTKSLPEAYPSRSIPKNTVPSPNECFPSIGFSYPLRPVTGETFMTNQLTSARSQGSGTERPSPFEKACSNVIASHNSSIILRQLLAIADCAIP